MSHSSKAKKVKPKGSVRELKLVNSVTRRGADILKSEEVKTPKKKAESTSRRNCSSSPTKRPKLDVFCDDAISCDLEGPDAEKRQTMVFLFQF